MTQQQGREGMIAETHRMAPTVLPPGWLRHDDGDESVAVYRRNDGMVVIYSVCRERDGKAWLHVSTSRRGRLPSWSDLVEVKRIFIGADRTALQILPQDEHYVNVHPNVLHLWCCLDGDVVPRFDQDGHI